MRDLSARALLVLVAVISFAAPPAQQGGEPPGQAKKEVAPPGLAKKGGLPPGLAKQFGKTAPQTGYIALDPQHDDRAWFLVNGRWVLHERLEDSVRAEVRQLLAQPAPPQPISPPVPLPPLNVRFRIVAFG
jgi:hypothetical protein